MRSFLANIVKIYEFVQQVLIHIGMALVLALVLIVSVSVFLRRTEFAIGWALEFSEYILIIVTFFGAGWVLRSGKHVRVDLLNNLGSKRFQLIYNVIAYLVVSLICLVVTVVGIYTAWEAFYLGTLQVRTFTFPKWILFGIIPVGLFFVCAESAAMSVRYFKQLRNEPRHSH
jgi:TRAP-type C4-dicarboxylate transport system permease small subunit